MDLGELDHRDPKRDVADGIDPRALRRVFRPRREIGRVELLGDRPESLAQLADDDRRGRRADEHVEQRPLVAVRAEQHRHARAVAVAHDVERRARDGHAVDVRRERAEPVRAARGFLGDQQLIDRCIEDLLRRHAEAGARGARELAGIGARRR
ncbi:MAG: hypothetical protein ABI867_12015 [Kofleriaceae bacterium]